jgi:hypothetical protein
MAKPRTNYLPLEKKVKGEKTSKTIMISKNKVSLISLIVIIGILPFFNLQTSLLLFAQEQQSEEGVSTYEFSNTGQSSEEGNSTEEIEDFMRTYVYEGKPYRPSEVGNSTEEIEDNVTATPPSKKGLLILEQPSEAGNSTEVTTHNVTATPPPEEVVSTDTSDQNNAQPSEAGIFPRQPSEAGISLESLLRFFSNPLEVSQSSEPGISRDNISIAMTQSSDEGGSSDNITSETIEFSETCQASEQGNSTSMICSDGLRENNSLPDFLQELNLTDN